LGPCDSDRRAAVLRAQCDLRAAGRSPVRECGQTKFFAARIDFESREPASGTLWFYEAEDLGLVGAADQLRLGFNGLLEELSPESSLRVRDEELVITTMDDESYGQRNPGQHRRRKP
jgi:hypothetical protein